VLNVKRAKSWRPNALLENELPTHLVLVRQVAAWLRSRKHLDADILANWERSSGDDGNGLTLTRGDRKKMQDDDKR